jgi:O-antigen ligase
MYLVLKNYFNQSNLLNLLIVLIPVSFIAGNLIINLNIFLIIVFTIIFYQNKISSIKLYFSDKLLIIFFIFCFFVGVINTFNFFEGTNYTNDFNILKKSILFLRYLLLYFAIRFLVENKIINFKFFFISATFCTLFVSFDLILQFFTGKDVFGYIKNPHKLSGPFGDEYIAGSYLQRFSIFSFFLLPFALKTKNKKILILLISLLFIIIFFSILVTGNRMPIILFLLMFFLFFLIEKKLKKYLLIFIPITSISLILIFNYSDYIEAYTIHFIGRVLEILIFIRDLFVGETNLNFTNTYLKEFYSGYITWTKNLMIGGGIDSYYSNCSKVVWYPCASHPHNYYLEILAELGIVGFCIIMIFFINILYMTFLIKKELILNFDNNLIFPFLLIFLAEIFPIKSSGSFFTTGNTTFIFFILAVIIGLKNKEQSN